LARAAVGLWPDYRRDRIRDALRRPPSRASAYLTRRGLFSPSEVQTVEALGDRLPPLVRQRQGKQGFTFPFALWLRGALKSRAEAALREVQTTGWLQTAALNGVIQAHEAGRAHWARLWAFVPLRMML
jgi:hypothetical protein